MQIKRKSVLKKKRLVSNKEQANIYWIKNIKNNVIYIIFCKKKKQNLSKTDSNLCWQNIVHTED